MFSQVLLQDVHRRGYPTAIKALPKCKLSLDTIQTLGSREPAPGVDGGILNAPPAPVTDTKPAIRVLAGNYTPPTPATTIPIVQNGASSSNMRMGCLVAAAITLTIFGSHALYCAGFSAR
jgi:hypothetical protein